MEKAKATIRDPWLDCGFHGELFRGTEIKAEKVLENTDFEDI